MSVQDCIKRMVRIGDAHFHNGMSVFPLFSNELSTMQYISLRQALMQQAVTITEVSQGGSVPNLKVINQGSVPVLLLDGEEISGAKQNRILNTSILLMEKSETIIPVSCTERGRWSYDKPVFEESGNMMTAQMRADKLSGVTFNLKYKAEFRSDQGKVWADIDRVQQQMGVHSPTSAMLDVYQETGALVQEQLAVFTCEPVQCGIAVCFVQKVIGLDYISLPQVWADVHQKLVKSYALEYVMLQQQQLGEASVTQVQTFLDGLQQIYPEMFKSVGYGEDYRFTSSELIGSALSWQDTLIHLEAYSRSPQVHETHYHSPRYRD